MLGINSQTSECKSLTMRRLITKKKIAILQTSAGLRDEHVDDE
jgi:hypothetical protein